MLFRVLFITMITASAAHAEIWSCANRLTGRSVYTVAPANSTTEVCKRVNLNRSTYGKVSAKAFEQASREAVRELGEKSEQRTVKKLPTEKKEKREATEKYRRPWSYQASWADGTTLFPPLE